LDDLDIFEEVVRLKKAGRTGVLATVIESGGSTPRKAGAKLLLRDDGTLLGTVGGGRLEEKTVEAAREVLTSGLPRTLTLSLDPANDMVCGGSVRIYLEALGRPRRLLILGSGHVGQALARFARPAGFSVTLVDPADSRDSRIDGFVPPDFRGSAEEAFAEASIDTETFVVIASPSHHIDFTSVQAALRTPARYIGMLGSRRKREALGTYLKQAGYGDDAIARVTTPAGLAIGAQTPEEIAVSILAQLIAIGRQHALHPFSSDTCGGTVPSHGTTQAPAALR